MKKVSFWVVKANNSDVKIVKITFYKGKTMIMTSDLENPHQRENLMNVSFKFHWNIWRSVFDNCFFILSSSFWLFQLVNWFSFDQLTSHRKILTGPSPGVKGECESELECPSFHFTANLMCYWNPRHIAPLSV